MKSENLSKYFLFGIFTVIFATFLAKSLIFLDPDFGWHYQMGNYILHHGIPQTDPFSYSMPSFPFIDHEWLSNIIIFVAYTHFGKALLGIIFSLFALLSLFTIRLKRYRWTLSLQILAITILFQFFGIRMQVISWVFSAVLLTVILRQEYWKKWRIGIPLLFALWANMHASFAYGISILFIFLTLRFLERKKISVIDNLIFLTSFACTFINPYGIGMWEEVLRQISDPNLRWSIVEWLPAFGTPLLPLWILVVISVSLVLRYRKFLPLVSVGIFFFTLLLSLSSVRHVPLWVLVALPVTNEAFFYFQNEIKEHKESLWRFFLLVQFLFFVSIATFITQGSFILKDAYTLSEEKYYPKAAINYLKNHPTQKNIFSEYNWGGYLIWKYREKKVFVDGRMPSWRWKAPNSSESDYAYKDYRSVIQGKIPFKAIMKKYNIDTVLLLQAEKKTFGKKLTKLGMRVVYKDSIATIYRK